ncbi:Holliday junction branch migration protein RuvA [Thiocapsa imhoffii]|uniref:Holliday junction branch migration complex subunit RuvA n=1 Tax=Thiocapsa imhoffii TaxID=382777 RepID=A0A9X1B7X7_9GAMM|nr:Holliday junction branch migration protein RuvA [Thiocapsa imhoffii]MBK1643386.1 Holliday junction branch migration protein RuvA [Thiocapsa imhoffii]
MIGRLQGRILAKHPPHLMLDVNGVGYELEAPMSTFYALPAVGEMAILVTHLVIREDAHSLYGFHREQERGLFRVLIKVTGIGPRMALAILSSMDATRFSECIEQGDLDTLMRVPGVGRKTAQRLVMELRDRLGATSPQGAGEQGRAVAHLDTRGQTLADAVSALVALGYRPADATRMARAADDGVGAAEDLIRAALRTANAR